MSSRLNLMQGILWSKNAKDLDLQTDKNYIIHQVLMHGSLEQISWLKQNYSPQEIKQVFTTQPKKIYTPAAFNFIKNYLLKIEKPLEEKKYVKTLF